MAIFSASAPFIPAKIDTRLPTDQRDNIRSLPELIEYNARHNPNHIFCVQARKKSSIELARHGLLEVTHLQLKTAIIQCSRWLVAHIGELRRPRKDGDSDKIIRGPPIALFMESDIGILIHLFSLLSLGVPVVLLSARLSAPAVAYLLEQTSAKSVIASKVLQSTANEAVLLSKRGDETVATLYSPNPYDLYLENGLIAGDNKICDPNHYIDQNDRNVLVLHSSGTTGLPKPIYTSHEYWMGYATCHDFKTAEEAAGLSATTLPLYHGFGLHSPALSLSVGHTMAIPASSTVPTGFSTVELLLQTKATSLMTVPVILEEICALSNDKGIDALLPLQYVAFGGGPLKHSIGDQLTVAGVRLLKVYGTTETGPIATIFKPTSGYDWHYFRMRDDMDLELRPMVEAGDEMQQYQLIAHPPGWTAPFEVQDRLLSNPKNPLEFNPAGRTDDLIILVTGEKVMPAILEAKLSESVDVKTAIAFGDGQFELGIIVEPASPLSPEGHDQFKTKIWPLILDAGSQMDNHAKISSKEAIIIVPSEKKIPRSDKGSVLRKDTLQLFATDIKRVYVALDSPDTVTGLPCLSMNRLEEGIKNLIQKQLNWSRSESDLGYSDDLFELGMDSLQAARLRRLLLSSIPKCDESGSPMEKIPRDFVYHYPSIGAMADSLRKKDREGNLATSVEDMMAEYVKRYSTETPDPDRSIGPKGIVVLLTGSTGSLGTFLLAHLSSLSSVDRVICLNRMHSEPAEARQARAAASKGVYLSDQAWSKIQVIQTCSAAPLLGLEKTEYEDLRKNVTHILHNAWPMNFKRTLSSFESHFQTLKNLINLARDAYDIHPVLQPRLLFISSISVVGQYGHIHNISAIPEVAMTDNRSTLPFGYGQAKLVCERIIENAANAYSSQIEAGYVRLGQIAGSTKTGFWNSDEHFPAMLKSSQYIGWLPRIEGTLSWLPVDHAAESLSELLLAPVKRPGPLIYHLENPIRQSAQGTLAVIASKLGIPGDQFLTLNEWVEKVCAAREGKKSSSGTNPITKSKPEDDQNPAKALAQFFIEDFQRMSGGDVVMETKEARNMSPTLARMDMVSEDLIATYIDHWREVGFL